MIWGGDGRLWIGEVMMVSFSHFIFYEDHFCMDDVSSACNLSEAYLHSDFAFRIISVKIISYISNMNPSLFDSP